MDTFKINANETIELGLQITGVAGVTDETPKVEIQKTSDDTWWDGSAWQSTVTALSMSEEDSTNLEGYYTYSWLNDGEDTYRVHYFNADTNGYGLEALEVYIAGTADSTYGSANNTLLEAIPTNAESQANFEKLKAIMTNKGVVWR